MKKIRKSKLIKEAFKLLVAQDPQSFEEVQSSLNQYLRDVGIPAPADFGLFTGGSETPDVPNKSAPAFNTLDFDKISSFFDD